MTEQMLKGLRSALNWNRANGRNGVVIRLKELEALVEIAEREQWVKTGDRLPTGHEYDGRKYKPNRYLAVWQGKSIDTATFIDGHFRLYGERKDHLITHWMPLPELPEGEHKE